MRTLIQIVTVLLLLQSMAIAQIVSAEYYFDADPGQGNRTAIEIPEGDTVSILNHIDKAGLTPGLHTVYFSYFTNEVWSTFIGELIYIRPAINQSLTIGEYFFDNDPGIGMGTAISVTETNTVEGVLEFNTNSLNPGFHTVFLRLQDKNGNWSLAEGRQLYITDTSTAIVATYGQIDDQKPIRIDNSASSSVLEKVYSIETTKLPAGLHTVSIETIDNNGLKSIAETRYFSVTEPATSVAMGEFFIDHDPGIGNGTPLTIPVKDTFELELDISKNIQSGFHTIYIRYQDNAGMWSAVEGRQFYVKEPYTSSYQPPIVRMEFFLGQDPGASFAIPVQITEGDTVETEITVLTNGMEQNTHSVSVRVQDSAGRWSLSTPEDFQVFECEIAEKPEKPFGDTALCKDNANTVYKTAGGKWATGYTWAIFPPEAGTLKGTLDTVTVNWNADFFGDAYISVQGTNDCYPSPFSDSLKIHIRDIAGIPLRPEGSSLICAGADSIELSINQAYNSDSYLWIIEPESAGEIASNDTVGYLNLHPDFFGYANISVQSENNCFISNASQTLIAQVLPPIIEGISGEPVIHGNQPAELQITLGGTSPWTVQIHGETLDSTFTVETSEFSFAFNFAGEFTISATESGQCSMKRDVAIRYKEIVAEQIILPQTIGVQLGEQAIISPIIIPENTSNKSLTWVSEDTLVALINQNGTVIPQSLGLTNIYAISPNGDVFGKTVLSVVESVIPANELLIPDSISVVIGQQTGIPFEVKPFNATNSSIQWILTDKSIAEISPTGQIKAKAIGAAEITATIVGSQITAKCSVYVTASMPPLVKNTEQVVELGTESTLLNLKELISDDSTGFESLQFEIISPDIAASITDSVLNINSSTVNTEQTDSILVKVTDGDGLVSMTVIVFRVMEAPNQAPVVFEFPESVIQKGGAFSPINLNKRVFDDYTDPADIVWKIEPALTAHYGFSIINNILFIENKIPSWIGTENFMVIATDQSGLSDTSALVVGISLKANEAPTMFPIPVQVQTEAEKLSTLPLYQYIVDDYTQPEFIEWSQSASTKIKLAFDGAIAFIDIIDDTWIGQESIWLTASDEEGLMDSVLISFVQEGTVSGKWYSKPKIDFSAESLVIGAEEEIQMQAKLYGAETWLWQFIGASPNQANTLSPRISYTKPGIYPITLLAANQEFGVDTLTKKSYITVIGIKQSDTLVCYGDEITIQANAPNLDRYLWNGLDGDVSTSFIALRDTIIKLEAKEGLFTYVDSVTISVSAKVDLGTDLNVCSGNSIIFDAGDFAQFKWNDNVDETAQTFVAKNTGKYWVEVVDTNKCTTSDTIFIVNELKLPNLSLPDSLFTCLNTAVSINAGTHAGYNWSNGDTESITNTAVHGYTSVTVTGDNGCLKSDSVFVFVQQPFSEQIGIVTIGNANTNVIVAWERTSGKGTESYNVYREETTGFEFKGNVPYSETSIFVDETADFRTRAYKYVITAIDTCGNESAIEDCIPHKTMHLRRSEFQGTFQLEWSAYEGFEFSGYRILEGKDGNNLTEIESVPDDNLSYSIPNYAPDNYYQVAVIAPAMVTPKKIKSDSGPFSQSISNLSEAVVASSVPEARFEITVLPNPNNGLTTLIAKGFSSDQAMVNLVDALGNTIVSQYVQFSSDGTVSLQFENVATGYYTLQVQFSTESIPVPILITE